MLVFHIHQLESCQPFQLKGTVVFELQGDVNVTDKNERFAMAGADELSRLPGKASELNTFLVLEGPWLSKQEIFDLENV